MTVNIEGLGKITASKDVLNALSSAFSHEAQLYADKGKKALFLQADKRSNDIYYALDKVGYYDNIE